MITGENESEIQSLAPTGKMTRDCVGGQLAMGLGRAKDDCFAEALPA